jgi:RNA polymerase sigma-70 factor, ECF subfamily
MSEELAAEDLLARVARRDVAALGELYDRYAPCVYGLMARILNSRTAVEEILRDVFVRLWAESGQLSEQGPSVEAWLVITAREAAIGRLRDLRSNSGGNGIPSDQRKPEKEPPGVPRRTRTGQSATAAPKVSDGKNEGQKVSPGDRGKPLAIGAHYLAWLPQPKEINAIDDRLGLLHKAIDQLPKPQRQALELAVFQGMRESEIAVELGEPLGKVRSSLRAAVTYIKHRRRAVCGSWAANI